MTSPHSRDQWLHHRVLSFSSFYRPQTKFAKVMFFTGVCLSTRGGCVCVVLLGGHVWFYLGGCAWFYSGMCMVLFRGCAWFCLGGHAWFYLGGVHGFSGGDACFFSFFGYNEIRSMSGRHASNWNAFLSFDYYYSKERRTHC